MPGLKYFYLHAPAFIKYNSYASTAPKISPTKTNALLYKIETQFLRNKHLCRSSTTEHGRQMGYYKQWNANYDIKFIACKDSQYTMGCLAMSLT